MNAKKSLDRLKGKPFTRKEMVKLGLTGNDINTLISSDQIERVSRGVYRFAGDELSDQELFRMATIRIVGPSVICLLSALAYYQLTDSIPKKVWMMTEKHKRTIHKDIRLFRSRNPHLDIGIQKDEGFLITTVERTLVDCLVQRKLIGTSVAIEGLRKALKLRKVTLSEILKVAERLGVEHRIHPYIESFS